MSERRHNPISQCVGKVGFISPSLAYAVNRKRARIKPRRGRGPKRLIYHCKHCGLWHLGGPMP